MKKRIFVFAFFVCLINSAVFSQTRSCAGKKALLNNRQVQPPATPAGISDTLHIVHYTITIDTIDYSAQTIRGNTELKILSKQNGVENISLMLLNLQVDSVKAANQVLGFSYNDTILRIAAGTTMNINDSIKISVFYQGHPQQDPSGWGGFYFSGNYAFNLGVGFDADPHSFGRVWFPCIDEFTDKSTYDFFITTPFSYKAFCNGILESNTDNGNNTRTWHWKMNQPIGTYLACVAVAPFYTLERNYAGIPVELGILAADSNNTIATYENLDTCVKTFVNAWGDYPFDKIGFVMTPVTYGGMEHATSIHLSKVFVNGTKNYETLWAHELSHMWWGDFVTCDKQEEMWINEGWATFNEHIFTEAVYGADAYRASFRKDHREVLQFAHIEDGNYWAMNNLPHAYTYASLSVYTKGALVAHTLRSFMGDDKFFEGCRYFLNNFGYGNANSSDLMDALEASSGLDLSGFFEGWIFTPGFPHFSIDSTKTAASGSFYEVSVYMKQKQKGNNHIYRMNVEVNFTDGINDTDIVFPVDNYTNFFTATLPFAPLWISVDRHEKMMDAVSDLEKTISANGTNLFAETNVTLSVQDTGSGKSIVRIEHNFVAPDFFKDSNAVIRLSDYHYWKVDGLFSDGFRSKATFTYDGSNSTTSGYLDNTFITTNEDSLLLLYRTGAGDDWKIVNGYTHNKGVTTDKKGNFVVDTLKRGEYTLGRYDYTILRNKFRHPASSIRISVFPNPGSGLCRIDFADLPEKPARLIISDGSGKTIYSTPVYSHQPFIHWDTFGLSAEIYYVRIFAGNELLAAEKFVKVK